MAIKFKGLQATGSSYRVGSGIPLDQRLVVSSYSDLFNSNTFLFVNKQNQTTSTQTAYPGMVVAVIEDTDSSKNGLYLLTTLPSAEESNWERISIPQISEDVEGKLLTVEKVNIGTAEAPVYKYEARWADAPNGLPTISQNEANKILQVNANGDGVAWVDTPDELPTFTTSDKDKVLTVSSDGNTTEWRPIIHPSELPAKTNNELKFLQVTADGKSVQWAETLPQVNEYNLNKSFLGTDFLGRVTWKPYQHRGTYDDLMMLVGKGQLVPGGTYILTDYTPQQTPINGIIGIFAHLLDYCFAQSTSDDRYLKYFQLLKRMTTNGDGSVVDIVLRADSTNSFERTAKMMTKSREFISEIVYNEYTNVLSESEINTLIGLFYSILPNIKADVEIELDATKIDINEILIYGIGEMGSGIFPEDFKGLIKYMKDSYGNEMPFDFKNVLIGDDLRYMFTDNYKPMTDRTLYVCRHNLSNTGKMRDVRYIIDDEYYNILGKVCSTNYNSIYNIGKIYYHFDFNQVANIGAFNSGSSTFINNVEIHNNPFFINDTLINGLKIFNDDKSIAISIRQNIDDILQEQGNNIINVVNSSFILNNVTIKNSAHFIHSLGDSVVNNFTFPIDPWTGNATITEIRKILRNITIDLPNNFENYKLLMNSEYLANYDAMPGDWPSISAYDHMLDISRQMSELIKTKSDLLESTSEAYENDLHKPGGHNDFNENLIKTITNNRYVSMMAPLSFGEFLGFKYPTTDTSGGESPVFCLLNLLRDAEKIYRIVADPNKGFVFKLQVPQFDDTPSTSVVELGL